MSPMADGRGPSANELLVSNTKTAMKIRNLTSDVMATNRNPTESICCDDEQIENTYVSDTTTLCPKDEYQYPNETVCILHSEPNKLISQKSTMDGSNQRQDMSAHAEPLLSENTG